MRSDVFYPISLIVCGETSGKRPVRRVLALDQKRGDDHGGMEAVTLILAPESQLSSLRSFTSLL